MAITLDGNSGLTTPTYNGNVTAEYSVPVTAFKNRLINSAMVIDQRNAGASTNVTNSQVFMVDRWWTYGTQNSKLTAQQSSTAPAGFNNSIVITSSSSYSVLSTDIFQLSQRIEGYNVADLNFGSANAKTITISFWVRSSLTGTFSGAILNGNLDRSYAFNYTISSANTWEQKTITIAGDTTGTWLTTNGSGLQVNFNLGQGSNYNGTLNTWTGTNTYGTSGSTNIVGTSGATFYITGVQLEKGSTATSFDYRPYGTELALCQRYYELGYYFLCCYGNGTNGVYASIPIKVSKRASPTATVVSTDSPVNVVGTVTTSVGGTANAATESLQLTYTGAPATGFTRVGANITMSAEL